MQSKEKGNPGMLAAELMKNRDAIAKLAASTEARQLMQLLEQRGGVNQAARAAAEGDTGALTAMVEALMQTEEGGRLARRIGERAKQAGME